MNRLKLALIMLVMPFSLFALTTNETDENNDGKPDHWMSTVNGNQTLIEQDRNFDGKVDYSLLIDENANRIEEELDYNFDGVMDDFYYYTNDVLVRREIDTNYDGNIDL